jgi:hypothetical protein
MDTVYGAQFGLDKTGCRGLFFYGSFAAGLTRYSGNLPALRDFTFGVEEIYALVPTENKTYIVADEFLDSVTQHLLEPQQDHAQAT